jgi:hypothetical protein
MSTITTYTRKHFDPVHPDPGLLCVEDFAHALPMICRGNGHVTTFWSLHLLCERGCRARLFPAAGAGVPSA